MDPKVLKNLLNIFAISSSSVVFYFYHLDYIQDLIRDGPTSFSPKKPTRNLPVTFRKSNKLLSEELDKYLKKKLTSNFGPTPERSEERNCESLKLNLVKFG